MSTINIDTMCFNPEMKKTFPADVSVYNDLQLIETQASFKELMAAKLDSSTLSTEDLLLRDYKDWTDGNVHYGIASAMLPISKWFLREDDFRHIFTQFCNTERIQLLVILMAYGPNGFERQCVFFQPPDSKIDLKTLIEKLQDPEVLNLIGQKEGNLSLQLKPHNSVLTEKWESQKIWFFDQLNKGCSRKQIQPLIAEFLKGFDKANL